MKFFICEALLVAVRGRTMVDAVWLLLLLLLAGCGTSPARVAPAASASAAADASAERQSEAITELHRLGIERVSRTSVDIGYGGRRGAIEPTHFGDDDLLVVRDLPDLVELSIHRGQVTDR